MTATLLKCPLRILSNKTAAVLPAGSFIPSPGGTYFFEICSSPQERKFLDFKGEFELAGYWWTVQHIPAIARKASLGDHRSVDNWESFLFEFFGRFHQGKSLALPSCDRFFWSFLFLLLLPIFPLRTILNPKFSLSPFWLMAHKDEGSVEHQGKNFFHSYLIRPWWFDGSSWKSGKTCIKTIRWKPITVFSTLQELSVQKSPKS